MEIVPILNYTIALFSLFTVIFFLLLFLKNRNRIHSKPPDNSWTPKVSIIIPAYNEGEFVRKSLESVLALEYPKDKLEVLLINDGSTDNTLEIAKEYEKDGVKVFTKENKGKGAGINFGLKHATGELVATMDADSYLTSNCLKEMLPLFKEDVAAVTPSVKVRESDNWIKEFQRVEYLMILFSRKLLSYVDCVPVTPGPFSMFRKKAIDDVGGFDEHNLVEDQEIALKLQAHNYKIASSMTADVYTEPPDNLKTLLKQRIRWQRGGLRNYWRYKFLIKPKYGDFGMFFVPLNYLSILAFFVILGLMINALLYQPYYSKYIWLDSIGLSIGLFTIIGAFVVATSILFLYLSVSAFKGERVKIRYILAFMLFYWYLMLGYNVMTFWKELRREPTTW